MRGNKRPCSQEDYTNSDSACPVKAGVPIDAEGIIPINENDVAGIPDLALRIPDFEGQAILRIFSNSTHQEVGCFAAQVTNGNTFRQQVAVGAVLGVFTLVAVLSSFATAIYGDDIVEMRKHYAHSVSVMVVFAVWHHIYFTGALSMNWPNVLVSFWSNYAWTGGMIYSEHMQNSINNFIGSNKGNTSQVGAAGTGDSNPNLGGGYDISALYKRELAVSGGAFSYTGQPVKPGLPLPGNFSGFAGTLAQERIPASNAFMTSLLWSLVLVAGIIASVVALNAVLEALSKCGVIRRKRLSFFRSHWVRYTVLAVFRMGFICFFMVAFLSMFQFAYLRSPSLIAVACVVFLVVVFGIGTAAGLACYSRISSGEYAFASDTLNIEKTTAWRFLPWYRLSRESASPRSEDKQYVGSIQCWTIRASSGHKSIHDDEAFIRYFGWLASRYRRTRWWFFVVWLIYEFTRACFLAGASSHPRVQVLGLVAVEAVAFVAMICLRPFEGQRLNVVIVYLLGLSKVTTTGLSFAFDKSFNLARIPATVFGIIIIVIQGLLTVALLVVIAIGAVSSYLSIMRGEDQMRPRGWIAIRTNYVDRIDQRALDVRRPRSSHSVQIEPGPEMTKGPYFSVNHVRRVPKVEDEDEEFLYEIHNPSTSQVTMLSQDVLASSEYIPQRNRAASNLSQISQSTLPRAARLHRPSWTSQEFARNRLTGRRRATSDATLATFESPNRPMRDALPKLDTQGEGKICASPLSTSASSPETWTSSPDSRFRHEEIIPFRQTENRPRTASGSNTMPTISESPRQTHASPTPRKTSIRVVTDTEEAD